MSGGDFEGIIKIQNQFIETFKYPNLIFKVYVDYKNQDKARLHYW